MQATLRCTAVRRPHAHHKNQFNVKHLAECFQILADSVAGSLQFLANTFLFPDKCILELPGSVFQRMSPSPGPPPAPLPAYFRWVPVMTIQHCTAHRSPHHVGPLKASLAHRRKTSF